MLPASDIKAQSTYVTTLQDQIPVFIKYLGDLVAEVDGCFSAADKAIADLTSQVSIVTDYENGSTVYYYYDTLTQTAGPRAAAGLPSI